MEPLTTAQAIVVLAEAVRFAAMMIFSGLLINAVTRK